MNNIFITSAKIKPY